MERDEHVQKITEEKIKWLWEQLGFRGRFINELRNGEVKIYAGWEYPNGRHRKTLPQVDLNNLICKYAVPAFRVRGKYPYIMWIALEPCDEEIYNCHLQYSSMDEDGFVDLEDAHGSSEDPGVAVFDALCEMLNYE